MKKLMNMIQFIVKLWNKDPFKYFLIPIAVVIVLVTIARAVQLSSRPYCSDEQFEHGGTVIHQKMASKYGTTEWVYLKQGDTQCLIK